MDTLDFKMLQKLVDTNPAMKDNEETKKIVTETGGSMLDAEVQTVSETTDVDNLEEFEKSIATAKPKKEVDESKDKEVKDDKKTEVSTEVIDTEEDSYKPWAETWKERGFIDFDEEEYNKAEDKETFIYDQFDKKYQEDIEKFKEDYVNSIQHPFIQQMVKLDNDGFDITQIVTSEMAIKSYESIDPDKMKENPELCKKVVKDFLIKTGAVENEKELKSELEDIEENSLMEKKAEKALPKLIQLERKIASDDLKYQQKQRDLQLKQYNDYVKETNDYIKKNKEIIPGITLTEKEQKAIAETLTKTDIQGKSLQSKLIEKDKMKFNVLSTYLAMNDWDFKKVEKAMETKVTQKVKSTLQASPKKEDSKAPNLNVFKKALNMK